MNYERDPDKRPAAVVLLTRGPLVLALTRGGSIADLHLPGGKEEDEDSTLVHTARRELWEETSLWASVIRPLVDYVAHTGRPVSAYMVEDEDRPWPDKFQPTEAGWPGWVDPEALLTRWCTYREECWEILKAWHRLKA